MTTRRRTAGAAAVIGLAATAALAQLETPPLSGQEAERLRPAFRDGSAIPKPTDPSGGPIRVRVGRPEVSAADFLNQTRQRSTAEVERLSERREQLRAQLQEVEDELARWRAIDQALASAAESRRRPGSEASPNDAPPTGDASLDLTPMPDDASPFPSQLGDAATPESDDLGDALFNPDVAEDFATAPELPEASIEDEPFDLPPAVEPPPGN